MMVVVGNSNMPKVGTMQLVTPREEQVCIFPKLVGCCYATCVHGGEEEDCNNIKHALLWKTIKLEPIEQVVAWEMMDDYNFEIVWGANGQHLADSIC